MPLDPVQGCMLSSTYFLLLCASLVATGAMAQNDGLVAYVPSRPIPHTADAPRVGLIEGPVQGKLDAAVPEDALQVDVLNARGNVVRSYGPMELDEVDLSKLRAGTWTLRVHTAGKLLVQRFAVLHRGSVIWNLPKERKRR